MPRSLSVMVLALSLAACSGESTTEPPPPPADGPLALAIVSGQNQRARAGDHQLLQPVVGQLVRAASGRLVFRLVGDISAQTTVSGSPVPGAVVCAVATDSAHKLTPFTPCTNTDSTGKATFFFTPPTTAGEASAEIRGTYQNQPAVFDTARADVLPGPATSLALRAHQVALFTGQSFGWRTLVAGAADQYGNATTTDSVAIAGDTLATSEATGSVRYTLAGAAAQVTVRSLEDLSQHAWTYVEGCTYHNLSGQTFVRQTTMTSTGVAYVSSMPAVDSVAPWVVIHLAGTRHEMDPHFEGTVGQRDTTFAVSMALGFRQFPDSLRPSFTPTMHLVAASPRAYSNGVDECPAGYIYDSRTPATLTAIP